MGEKSKKITIKDIAQEVGVSPSTVSRVINNSENVHEYTREKVKKAIRELNYSKDLMATALKTGESKIIHVVMDALTENYFVNKILVGVEQRAKENGYRILITMIDAETDKEDLDLDFTQKYADGILYISSFVHKVDLTNVFLNIDMPVVCVYSYSNFSNFPCIIPDDFQGAFKAIEHLADKGCKKIGFINGPSSFLASKNRLDGYQRALQKLNLSTATKLVETGDWSEKSGYHACNNLINNNTDLDAIFAGNDRMAVGVFDALKEHKLKVPDDIAVIGFDNMEFCQYIRPRLSSIAVPLARMGEKGFDLLLSNINTIRKKSTPDTSIIKIPCEVEERESTVLS